MPKKLLLADSSITIQKVVELSLSDEGFQVTSARDGDTAFRFAKEIKPDIVLADIFLPSIDGYELCKKMKEDPDLKDIPVILLVGKSESFDMNRANLSGAADFINKPFESSELIEKVKGYSAGEADIEVVELTEIADVEPAAETPLPVDVLSMPEDEIASSVKEVAERPLKKEPEEEMELVSFENLDKARELEDSIIPKTTPIETKEEKADEEIPFYDITELEEPAEAKMPVSKKDIDAAIKGMISHDDLKQRLDLAIQGSVSELLKTVSVNEVKAQIASSTQKYSKEIAAGISKEEIMSEMGRILNQIVRERVGGVTSQEMKDEQMKVVKDAAKDAVKSMSPDAIMRELKKGIEEEGKKVLERIALGDAVKEIVRENIQRLISTDIKNDILPIIEQEAKRLVQNVSIDDIRSGIEKSTSKIFEEKLEGMIMNISKEIIEKVAWEIVPSLAEVIISKEIEKIKAED